MTREESRKLAIQAARVCKEKYKMKAQDFIKFCADPCLFPKEQAKAIRQVKKRNELPHIVSVVWFLPKP